MQSIYARKVTFNKQGKNNKFQVRMIWMGYSKLDRKNKLI